MATTEPKVGATVEYAIWLNGSETVDHIRQWKTDAPYMMANGFGPDRVLELSPLRWTIKRPGEERVPPVPDHVQGDDVRLLIAEAEVVRIGTALERKSFLTELEPKDLSRLRKVTRRAIRKAQPGCPNPTDEDCDNVIESLGPTAAMKNLRDGMQSGAIN